MNDLFLRVALEAIIWWVFLDQMDILGPASWAAGVVLLVARLSYMAGRYCGERFWR